MVRQTTLPPLIFLRRKQNKGGVERNGESNVNGFQEHGPDDLIFVTNLFQTNPKHTTKKTPAFLHGVFRRGENAPSALYHINCLF